jgi:cobalamin biosynthesis protein CobD/CbiB
MATMAGVLNVCLEKKGQYALNKAGAPPCYKSIRIGHDIALLAGLLAVFVALVVSIVGDMHAESDATSL